MFAERPNDGPNNGPDSRGPQGGYHEQQQPHFSYRGHDLERGHAVPDEFRGARDRVDDWQDRGLPSPPHGQHWAYIDGNYLLVAATTGIITSMILNNMHP